MPYVRNAPSEVRRHRYSYQSPCPPIWTGLGGIVWMGVAVWLLINFGVFAISGGFFDPYPAGVTYNLPDHRLRSTDIPERVNKFETLPVRI